MSTKSTTPNTTTTEIAFILDRSGSMYSHVEAAVAGFNDFLRDQQEVAGKARITLVLFDDQYEVPLDNLPVSEVTSIDQNVYTPRGSTALLDAIGKTIKSFRKRIKELPKEKRPDKVIFAIFTDGLENASCKYDWLDVGKMIRKRQKKDGWEFLFLAAGQDAIATAAAMNIHQDNAATVDNGNRFMMRDSSRAMSRKVRAMRMMDAEAADLAAPMEEILREEEGRE
ncbi:MAG: VWA domain-containing protein [Verrucomicrobiales bacterium]|nr:VWA domain-containing protein [Verrucomicrobiales bacterium]